MSFTQHFSLYFINFFLVVPIYSDRLQYFTVYTLIVAQIKDYFSVKVLSPFILTNVIVINGTLLD